MQITKEQIIEVLRKHDSHEGLTVIYNQKYIDVADEILTLLQSNDAGQPNGSKPNVSGALPHPCADPLFDIIGCNMPKGSCSACGGNDR